jgi:hypothetical protein
MGRATTANTGRIAEHVLLRKERQECVGSAVQEDTGQLIARWRDGASSRHADSRSTASNLWRR